MSNEYFFFQPFFLWLICSHIERPHDHSFLRPLSPPRRSRGGQPTRSFSLCLFVVPVRASLLWSCVREERKKTDNPQGRWEGSWEDGTPPPHRRGVWC